MSADAPDAADDVEPGQPAEADADPGQRGRLTVADRVVAKVAVRAVSEVDGAAGAPRRVLGVAVGEAQDDRDAQVTARVDGLVAVVQVAMAVHWPASAREVSAEVRHRVRDQVQRITGVDVRQVDVEVVSMTVAERARARVA